MHRAKLLFLLLLTFSATSQAQQTPEHSFAQSNNEPRSLSDDIRYLEDTNHELTIEKILNGKIDVSKWKKNTQENFSRGFSQSTWWLSINTSIDNTASPYLEIGHPLLDEIEVWIINDSQVLSHYLLGDNLPQRQRPINNRNFAIPLNEITGGAYEIIIRVKSTSSIRIPVRVWASQDFWNFNIALTLAHGLIYGALFFMVINNLLAGIILKDRIYIQYVFFLLPLCFLLAAKDGWTFQYLWPNSITWNQLSIPTFIFLATTFATQFVRQLLELDSISKVLTQISNYLSIALVIALVATITVLPYAIGFQLAIGAFVLTSLITFVFGIIALTKKNPRAKYFALIWAALIPGGLTYALEASGVIPSNLWTQLALPISVMLEMVILSFVLAALTDREKMLSAETQKASIESMARAKARNQFFATISHEIRTPMNGIIGIAELLKDSKLSLAQQKHIKVIISSGKTLLRIINDILDYSKIEENQLTIEKIEFDIEELINECVLIITPTANEKDIRIHVAIDDSAPSRMISDPTRLKQVLINLLSNAIKFTDTGSVKINLSVDDASPHNFLRLEVVDSGIGVPKNRDTNLFDPFRQADETTTRKYGGTGLGLSISKNLIELLGGTIGVKNNDKVGATFWFTVPLLESNYTSGNSEELSLTSSEASTRNLTSLSRKQNGAKDEVNEGQTTKKRLRINSGIEVLVADDNEVNRIVIQGLLEKLGANATITENGVEALEQYIENTKKFDLILMDCEMPVMDGYQSTINIREFEKSRGIPPIPIVAISAHRPQEYRDKSIASGMDEFLSKPIDLNELEIVVASYSASR